MSVSGSSSSEKESNSVDSDDFDMEFEDGVFIEGEESAEVQHGGGIVPYAEEPIATQEWQEQYERRQQDDQELLEKLKRRLDGLEPVDSWCNCGHCATDLLQNPKECLCCQEIDKCKESLISDEVLDDPAVLGTPPECITHHPGFLPICLNRWSLRQAADKLRTRERKRYQQTGAENTFLRSVAYREYIFMVYGHLGRLRQSLPSCAYNIIRKQFPSADADYKGYEESDDEQID